MGPMELVLLGALLLLMFGPKKVPELAKAIGKAVNEYRRASEGLMSEVAAPESESPLTALARKLNIDPLGKTPQQISEEILKKAGQTGFQDSEPYVPFTKPH